jgi:hypothetical protein
MSHFRTVVLVNRFNARLEKLDFVVGAFCDDEG